MARKAVSPENLQRIDRKLTRVKEAIEIAATEELTRSSNNIVALAKDLAPVITGEIRDSIRWEWDGEHATVIGSDHDELGRSGQFIVVELEHGTATRPAKPFLHPAFYAEEPVFRATLNHRISNELKKVRRHL